MPGRESVRPEKIEKVRKMVDLINRYSVACILNTYKLPASALQKIKRELHEKALVKITKKSLLLLALKNTEKKTLEEFIGNYPGLILTEMSPFKLHAFLKRNKTSVPAKAGDIAIRDIEIKAGPTNLPPGPAISTLTKVGIPAKVEGGKIAVMKDKIVLRAGETVSKDLAAALQLLKMEPMEIGLDVVAAFEKGEIYKKDVLSFDEEKLLNDLVSAHGKALNLCLSMGYPTKETIGMMLALAHMKAEALQIKMEAK
jgi:large subunit ribosomal protein L10